MTVYRNDNHGEVSNVVFDGTSVTHYQKNAATPPTTWSSSTMDCSTSSFTGGEPRRTRDVRETCRRSWRTSSVEGRLVGFEATNRFFEIGSPQGLAALEHELRLRSAHQAGS